MNIMSPSSYDFVVLEISALRWRSLSADFLVDIAWAYYYFSIQFRENLQIARALYPDDEKLQRLEAEECGTSNLSPWPEVAMPEERMDHDEFMRRLLQLTAIPTAKLARLETAGQTYLETIRQMEASTRAASIASYEDGGLETVFRAFLTAPDWNSSLLQAFRHFLMEHIRFDSDPEQGHSALSRHLLPDNRVLPLWTAFRQLLIECVPKLSN